MSRRQARNLESPSFGQRLREARNHKGLTQEKVARHLDVTLRTYVRWESDESDPRGEQVIALGQLLNVDPFDLYPEKEAA